MADSQKIDIKKHFSWIIRLPIIAFAIALLAVLFIFEYRNSINQSYFNLVNLERVVYSHNRSLTAMQSSLENYLATNEKRFLKSFERNRADKNISSKSVKNHRLGEDQKKILLPLLENSEMWEKNSLNKIKNLNFEEKLALGAGSQNFSPSYVESFSDAKKLFVHQKGNLIRESNSLRFFSIVFTIGLGFLFAAFIHFVVRKKVLFISSHYDRVIFKKEKQKIELQEVSKSKDLFLANMSHEIRTPLGAIIGFANLAHEDPSLSKNTKENIGFVKRNSQHLLGLIEDLFDLTKIGNDKLDLNLEKNDLFEILKDIKKTFSEKTSDSNQIFIFEIKGFLKRTIITDQLRFKQILTNLIGNAVKFTAPGKKITCTFEEIDRNLVVNIIDEGIGIDETKRELIYNSFEQIDSDHSRVFGGAGLGLSISKNLTQLLNGKLDLIWSQKQKGSHFRLSFPIKSVGSDKFDQEIFLGSESGETSTPLLEKLDLSNALLEKEILIAEDSMENQILFRIFIESAGAKVKLVENGRKAVEEALSRNYDVVIMDIQMPGMDGYQALASLRESNYKGKIIALTAHALKGDKIKALNSGFDGYLSKPVSKAELISSVFEQL